MAVSEIEMEAPGPRTGSVLCAFLSTLVVSLSAVVFGMTLGFTSPAIDVMQDTVRVDGKRIPAPSDLVVFSSQAEGSLFGALVNIGALVGALCGGPLSERIGRKGAILVQAPLYALMWFGTGVLSSFVPLLVVRFLLGVGIGLCSSTVPTYINEVAPTHMRGAFGAVFQMAVVVGIMFAYLLGAYVFTVDVDGQSLCQWRHLALAFIAPALALFCLGLVIPESPRFLASIGKMDSARVALAKLRGGAQFVDQELEEIHNSFQQTSDSSGLQDLWTYRRPFSIGLVLMLIQQLSGVNAVIFFQDTIFQEAGMANPDALGFWVMVLQTVMTAVSIPLMDTAGRKVLLLTACIGMCFCCLGMVIFFAHSTPGWLAMISSFAYIAFFSLGLGPIPWLMMGEIFPGKIRSSASSLAAALNWTGSFITTETVAALQEAITFSGVFALYGVVLALGTVYIALRVPETKGKSFAELEAMLGGSPSRDVALLPRA
eukprot:gb/GFBE01032725.1/.p1 GENE.gb/GFBE01032725.1/~~gb/GFBE01032725.1/.p1  ORF type:complete len:486 (+),score=83.65 gb/GFBE01032725.1/:1-1458(+)